MFCSCAVASCSGERESTTENTKNITKPISIIAAPPVIASVFLTASSPYTRRCSLEN
uniref:Serine transporter n=1 Tax=Vibrio sp. DAT722 TaxID=344879 RepID=Q2FA24_9VIBR|nr:serine transporter [Vibrio sp. DAT722]